MKFNKKLVHSAFIEQFKLKMYSQQKLVDDARLEANSPELKSDGKYDTRATEAKYLVDAMAVKLDALKKDVTDLERVNTERSTEVAVGSLVLILEEEKSELWYYLIAGAAGVEIEMDGVKIVALSIQSPIGKSLFGHESGDEVEVKTPKGIRVLSIEHLM